MEKKEKIQLSERCFYGTCAMCNGSNGGIQLLNVKETPS